MSWDDATPGEHEAGERSWRVVRGAYDERIPCPRSRPHWPVVALVAVLAIAAAVLSPPGMAVLDSLKEAVRGEGSASPALSSLPTQGRLLVLSESGAWVVQRDGSKRLLSDYTDASWSPRGLYLAAARDHELVALEPNGNVHWSLARRGLIRTPVWSDETAPCCRIAYRSGAAVRIVNGDGTGDKAWAVRTAPLAPAWRPRTHVVAYSGANGTVAIGNADADHPSWTIELPRPPLQLAWTFDGSRLLVVERSDVRVYSPQARLLRIVRRGGGLVAPAPGSHRFVLVRATAQGRSEVSLLDADKPAARVLFSGAGKLGTVTWSPDGRWLLVEWRAADQWLFLRPDAPRVVHAVASISQSFGADASVAGWCCP